MSSLLCKLCDRDVLGGARPAHARAQGVSWVPQEGRTRQERLQKGILLNERKSGWWVRYETDTKLYIRSVCGADGQAVCRGPCAGIWSPAELQGPEGSRARGPAHTAPSLTRRCSRIPAASALREHDTRPSLQGSARRQELQPSPRAALGQQRAPHIPWPSAQPQPCSAGRCRSWAGHTASPAFLRKTSKNTYFCKIMFLYVELCKYTRPSGEKKPHRGPAREAGGAEHIT